MPIIRMSGNEFKHQREHNGYTQAELAKVLEVSIKTVYNWEQNGAPKLVVMALKDVPSRH